MGTSMLDIQLRRIYEAPSAEDGIRVLVDRRWPRGVSKARAALDEWCAAVAPSESLRRWYQHDPARFDEFCARYRDELHAETSLGGAAGTALRHLHDIASHERLTLLTATRRLDLSHSVVLAEELRLQG